MSKSDTVLKHEDAATLEHYEVPGASWLLVCAGGVKNSRSVAGRKLFTEHSNSQ